MLSISSIISKYKNNKIARDAGLYMLFNILQKLVPFLILPILSRVLSVEGMGYYIMYQTIFNVVLPIITLNADSSILLNHYHLEKNDYKKYFSSGIILFLVNFIVLCIITALTGPTIARFVNFDYRFFFLMYAGSLFYFFNRLNLNMLQIQKKPIKYGIFSVSQTATENLLMLIFVFSFPYYSWKGAVFGFAIAQVLFFLYSFSVIYRNGLVNGGITKNYVIDALKVGWPLTLHHLGAWLGNLGSRFVVNSFIGTAAAGRFGIGVVFGTAMTLIQDSFNKAYTPNMLEKLRELENESDPNVIAVKHRQIVKVTYLYNLILAIIAVFLSITGFYLIGPIFGSEYISSREYIFWAVFAAAFNGMYKMHVMYMFYKKNTQSIASITITTGILNVILCILLINVNGMNAVGAAQSLMVTQLLAYLFSWYKSNKIYPMPWFKTSL